MLTKTIAPIATSPASPAAAGDLPAAARRCLDAAVEHLFSLQKPDGHWCAELEGDSILQSEYILAKWIIEQEGDPRLPRVANYLRRQQREDGTWGQHPGSGPDISATVKGYFALKLTGDSPDAPHMLRARQRILELGGAEKCNSFSKFYFACLGQVSFKALPSIPPEIVYLPKWFYFSLAHVSAWTRTMIAPLSIVVTKKPLRKLPADKGIDELFVDQKVRHKLVATNLAAPSAWSKFFLAVDRLLKVVDRIGTPWRQAALERIVKWIVDHTPGSDGLGAIYPPMVYILIALRAMGVPDDDPVIVKAHKDLDDLMIVDAERDEIRFQPCFSPVWDTGIAAYALTEAGYTVADEPLRRCADWLLGKECRDIADWADNVKGTPRPGGWFFEYNNPFYPDVDDTVMVAMALKRMAEGEGQGPRAEGQGERQGTEGSRDQGTKGERGLRTQDSGLRTQDALARTLNPEPRTLCLSAAERGISWVFAMQNDDGGWAAFDRTRDRRLLEYVPFADHNAIQDPSCPDITGRTLECLGHHGYRVGHAAVDAAVSFIMRRQEREGCWFGRWGVNYIYGTWQVVGGLRNVGCDMHAPALRQASRWLKSIQQPDGSFGETANSYEDRALMGTGPSTASQTAWAAMSLLALDGPNDPALHRAIQWLIDTQLDNGNWGEDWFTGTGFPKVFYLRYHYYKLYFPVMAIGRWLSQLRKSVEAA